MYVEEDATHLQIYTLFVKSPVLKVQRIQSLYCIYCVCACLECDVREETEKKNMLAAEAYLVNVHLKPRIGMTYCNC